MEYRIMVISCATSSVRHQLSILLISLLLCCGVSSVRATPPSVLTQHNDNARTGANLAETTLTPASVNSTSFGKLFTRTLDANVNGQVLYVPGLTINGGVHNVIYAYTSNNSNGSSCSIYAFDADDPNAAAPLWRHQLPNSAQWTTATPVIDPATHTLYALTKDTNDSGPTRLRAIDIITGNEKPGSPITIAASVPGIGDGNKSGVVSFDTTHANCRPGLLLLNGGIYIAFAHNSDSFPYHGWVFRYSYDQTKFTQTAVFCTDPNGGEAGIWMAGQGLAADVNNIYFATGNGTFDANSGGVSYGMCYVKLSTPNLNVADWFAPFDEQGNSNADLDLGNSGLVGIPGTDRFFAGGTKFGSVFLLDSANLGHFTSGGPDKVVQRFDHVMGNDNVGQNPICWDASAFKYVYLWPSGTDLLQYRYDPTAPNATTGTNGQFNPAGAYKQNADLTAGGSLAVTANGSSNGILWAVGNDRVVHALDATDVSKGDLWSSSMNAARDALPSVGHFQFPTAVNSKVYVPTGSASIVVYGLLNPSVTTVNGLYDTGVDNSGNPLPDSSVDAHYALISKPGGTAGVAYVTEQHWPIQSGIWLLDTTTSKWISPRADERQQLDAPGSYTYQTTFNITGNPASVQITGRLAADNAVTAVILNGVTVATNVSNTYRSWSNFTIASGFTSGANTLQFIVFNGGSSSNPSGFRVEMTPVVN
jgi:hypothetical protein